MCTKDTHDRDCLIRTDKAPIPHCAHAQALADVDELRELVRDIYGWVMQHKTLERPRAAAWPGIVRRCKRWL